jgi:hypothetical protein
VTPQPKPAPRGPKARKRIERRTPVPRSSAPIKRTVRPKAKRSTPAARVWAKADTLWRQLIKRRDPLCRFCRANRTTDAAHVYGRGNYRTRLNLLGGLGSCRRCHEAFDAMSREDRDLAAGRIIGHHEVRKLRQAASEHHGARSLAQAEAMLDALRATERWWNAPEVAEKFRSLLA